MNYSQRVLFMLLIGLARIAAECPGGIPVFGSLTQAIPSLRNMPGMNFIPDNKGINFGPENKNLNSAIEQFSQPLVRFASGGQPIPSDIDQLISSIPNLLVNIPGVGNVDISKLPPQLIDHVLKGGQVPGASKETLDAIMKQYMQKMYALAANAQNMQTEIQLSPKDYQNAHRFLPPLTKLPQRFVSNVMEGNSLPFLTPSETQVIKDYYLKRLPINQQNYSIGNDTSFPFSPELIKMMQFLPPGYNLSKIPKEVMQQIIKGEKPDFSLLPDDILQHFHENADKLFGATPNMTIEEIRNKLSAYGLPTQSSISPYDINKVDSGGIVILGQDDDEKQSRMHLLAIILLGFVGTITIVILAVSCYYAKRTQVNAMPSTPSHEILPNDEFRPISTSTVDNRSSKSSPSIV